MAWDAREYFKIAQDGYAPDRNGEPYREWNTFSLIAYFPLVPLVGRALSVVMPLDMALVLFSNLCSIVGFGLLYNWARDLFSERTAVVCVLIAATFPGAVNFSAGMTEGPFFLLVTLTLVLLQRKRFYWAALAAGIATATRPTGIALAAIVPIYAWADLNLMPLSRQITRFILLGAISISGIVGYETFLWYRYGSPTVYFEAQQSWDQRNEQRLHRDAVQGVQRYSPRFFIDRMTRPQAWNRVLALGVLLICAIGLYKPMGIPRVLFVMPLIIFFMTALPNHGLRVSSIPRYESAAAPLFLLIAIWLNPRRRVSILVGLLLVQILIQAYYAVLFPREIWVG